MSRYYLHVRDFRGDLLKDEEGADFPSVTAARDEAMSVMREIVGTAVKNAEGLNLEAVIVADDRGTHVASVPVLAALPVTIVDLLKQPSKAIPVNRFEEYRHNSNGCRRMAENSDNPDDKMSWLKLADAWLQMLPRHELATSPDLPGWPDASDGRS